MPSTKHEIGVGEGCAERINQSLFLIGYNNRRQRDMVGIEHQKQRFERPVVENFGFFSHETEGQAERLVGAGNSRDVEQRHLVFICLVCTIEEKNVIVCSEQFDRSSMTKE